jgi:hypothetical protein
MTFAINIIKNKKLQIGSISMKKILVKLILFLILFSLIASCTYSKSMQTETDWEADPLSLMVRFYRGPLNHLSAVRYGECPNTAYKAFKNTVCWWDG